MPRSRSNIRSYVEDAWGTATVYKMDNLEAADSVLKTRSISRSMTIIYLCAKFYPDPFSSFHVKEMNQYIGMSALSQHVISIHSISLDEMEETADTFKILPGCLPFFVSSLFCAGLEDAVTQMRVLEQCNNVLKIIKTFADKTQLTALKFGVKKPVVTDDLSEIDRNALGCTIYKIAKLDSDRSYVLEIFKNAYLEMALHRTFYVLSDNMQKIIDLNQYRQQLAIDEAKNKTLRKDLIKQVRQQRNRIRSVIYDTDVTIANLSSQVEDSVLVSETGCRYTVNWEAARTEQHLQTISDTENMPISNITLYKTSFEQEVRVHSEVELLVNITINETLTKIEDWMAKYDADLEKIDLKIQLKKNDHHDMYTQRVNMEETLVVHEKQMKDWIYFKDEREKARLYRLKMTNAAISVQAWWRGLLVRLQLGPYKPKPKPKKKKDF